MHGRWWFWWSSQISAWGGLHHHTDLRNKRLYNIGSKFVGVHWNNIYVLKQEEMCRVLQNILKVEERL